ncbi:MAG TPA: alpha-N-acetylglucosaminidase TIM-barrel domain-containing protein [Phycisphaerae bacterium]|nr:alpha-N-acetylglucosaminidase TIM-barrel domain-containing protein [Phycisphaerae bacterium]
MRVGRIGALIVVVGLLGLVQTGLAGQPRVLIIGDSISIGYTKPLQPMLRGEAEVVHSPGNAAHTWNGLEKIDEWIGQDCWDVIHFNWGLHDLKYMKDGKPDPAGQRISTLDQYKANLEKLVERLKKTGAVLIWASTTPIPEGAQGRKQGEEIEFNAAAAEIVARHRIVVNDLHARVLPELGRFQLSRNVHFTPDGSAFLALQVGQCIRQALRERISPIDAARGVIQRVLPKHVDRFVLEVIPRDDGKDVFEIESRDGKIVLRGNNGVSICSALGWYLKYHCLCHISWCGSQLNLPDPLPRVEPKFRQVSPHRYRYCLNYCAFSYTLAFWDFSQWEWLIDWMALHGINMPLSVTGQEAVWQAAGKRFGLSDEQMREFLPGPGYLPFGWMGCLDGWGGPLPQSWIDSHVELQKKILARQRELGMTPVLQGFTGHVPVGLKEKRPQAKFQKVADWCGFPGTTFVDPMDPLFIEFGRAFVEEQTRLFGTDHLYASDTFIEMSPPSSEPAFLAGMGKAVYEAMRSADPQAIWVMQGWIFHNNPKFWQPPQAKALFGAVPDDRMVLLEMGGDYWKTTEAYYGKPWVWTLIQDYGDKVSLHGDLRHILTRIGEPLGSPKAGKFSGLGAIMEGLGYNPVVYDLLTDLIWRSEMPQLEPWVMDFARRRYGRQSPCAEGAWKLLLESAYTTGASTNELLCCRPSLNARLNWTNMEPPFDRRILARANEQLLACADELGALGTYQFDVVNVTRNTMAGAAHKFYNDIIAAHQAGDREKLAAAGKELLDLIRDLDELLATRPEFLLGRWLADAKRWATNDEERKLYEWNARNQITLWGPRDSILHEYARKQWSGMLTGFYMPRWEMFLNRLRNALADKQEFDADAFERDVRAWEEKWTHGTEEYPTAPTGDPVAVARKLWYKYGKLVLELK